MYALIKNGAVAKYPYSIEAFRADNPNVSLPRTPADYQLHEVGLHEVSLVDQPTFYVSRVIEEVTPVLVSGVWTQQWQYRDATAVEIAAQQQQLIADVTEATQARLDAFAQSRNYDGILSACSYVSSTNAKFAAEGAYCVQARDQTWQALYDYQADVAVGIKPAPTAFADVEPYLPTLAWPE